MLRQSIHTFLFCSLFFYEIASISAALPYPLTTPGGETPGGTYRTYFDNMFSSEVDCYGSGKVVGGFNSLGVPFCVVPAPVGLNILGSTAGDTLRYNGTDWVRNNLLYNNGTALGIGMQTPGYILDVAGTANFLGLRMPTGASSGWVLTSDAAGVARWESAAPSSNAWLLLGNAGLSALTNFLGTTDDVDVVFRRNNIEAFRLQTLTGSTGSIVTTADAQINGLTVGRGGRDIQSNTAIGKNALFSNTTGGSNTANGTYALYNNTTGYQNTANGTYALYSNTTGFSSTANGYYALYSNTTGFSNTAYGMGALSFNTTGTANTANGNVALFSNTTGFYNTANGNQALRSNTTGSNNTANGMNALHSNTTGNANTANGMNAGYQSNVLYPLSGTGNTFLGAYTNYSTGNLTISNATAIGYTTVVSQSNTVILGSGADVGIGTSTPGAKLEVAGQVKITGGSPAPGRALVSDATGLASWQDVTATSVTATGITGGTAYYLSKFGAGGNGLYASLLYETGTYLGLGNTDPTASLDINGNIRIRSGAASGMVLVSDASGIATWQPAVPSLNSWNITGNAGLSALTNFLGTTDNVDVIFKRNNIESLRMTNSGVILSGGVLIGIAQQYTDPAYDATTPNLRFGKDALTATGNGSYNIAFGHSALERLTDGNYNIAIGSQALNNNLTSSENIAIGTHTLLRHTGSWGVGANIAIGKATLFDSTTGISNVAIGVNTLTKANASSQNVALGRGNLETAVTGDDNISIGSEALQYAGTASSNTALGRASMRYLVTPSGNIGIGSSALSPTWTTAAYAATMTPTSSTAVSLSAPMPGVSAGQYVYFTYSASSIPGIESTIYQQTRMLRVLTSTTAEIVISGAGPDQNLTVSGSATLTNIYRSPTYQPNNVIALGNSAGTSSPGGSGTILIGNGIQAPNATTQNQLNIGNWIYGSGGNIGIGTSTPGVKLEIAGQIKITGGTPGLNRVLTSDSIGLASWTPALSSLSGSFWSLSGNTIGANDYIGTNNNQSLKIYTNGTQKMVLTSAGRLGIGVTNPTTAQLELSGSALISGDLTVNGKIITDTIVNRTVNNVSISGSLFPDVAAPLTYRDIGSTTQRWNNLYLSGQVTIGGGSPGLGKVLTSDASGNAVWSAALSGATASGITGGTQNYLPKFGTGGIGLYISQFFDNGTNAAIGSTGATSKFEVWSGTTVSSSLLHFRKRNNVALGLGALRSTLADANENVGIGAESLFTLSDGDQNTAVGYASLRSNTTGGNNVGIGMEALRNNAGGSWNSTLGFQSAFSVTSGTGNTAIGPRSMFNVSTGNQNIAIGYESLFAVAGSAISNNIAIGSAALYNATASNNIAIGTNAGDALTSGSNNIAIGNNVDLISNTASNQLNIGNWIYGNGGNIGVGTGTNLTARMNIDSGTNGVTGLRLPRVNNNSTVYTGSAVGLGIDANGNVVPVSNGDVVVYDGLGRSTPAPVPDPNIAGRTIRYDFNKYFQLPTKQSFVVSDGNGAGFNAPYFKEDGVSGICSYNGSSGTSPYDCAVADPATGLSASPNNSFTMTARGTNYGYQIALGARGDAPLFARSGRWFGGASSYGSGLYLADGVTPTPWQKVLTVPANHVEYFYVNIGYNSQLQAITGGGNIGMGTSIPDMRLVLSYSGTTGSTSRMMRIERGMRGGDGSMVTAFGTPYLMIGGKENRANSIQTIGFGYNTGTSFQPAEIGFLTTSTTGNTQGDLVFATRNVTTNTAPSERMRIFSNGNISIGSTTNSAKLRVEGQIMITGGTPGAGKVLTATDATGIATWQPAPGAGGGTTILQATVNRDLPSIAASACSAETFTVTGAATGKTAWVSPATALTNRLIIAYTRVSAANTVEVKFCNESTAAINMTAMNFYLSVIQ